jgi:hypothetical protein
VRAREGNEGEAEDVEEVEEAEDRMRVALSSMSSSSATLVISSGQLSSGPLVEKLVRLMNPGSEASQGDKDGRVLPTDRSDVQMCLSMIILWIAMYTGFHSPLPSRSW